MKIGIPIVAIELISRSVPNTFSKDITSMLIGLKLGDEAGLCDLPVVSPGNSLLVGQCRHAARPLAGLGVLPLEVFEFGALITLQGDTIWLGGGRGLGDYRLVL